jgi:transcriptional regulator with XRE-family HTH domain
MARKQQEAASGARSKAVEFYKVPHPPLSRTAKAIGCRIRARRLERKMSQGELGARLGVTFQQIQKYENGKNRIPPGRLTLIANALECGVDQFITETHGTSRAPSKLVQFLATRQGNQLVEAMTRIRSVKVRQGLVDMARCLASVAV